MMKMVKALSLFLVSLLNYPSRHSKLSLSNSGPGKDDSTILRCAMLEASLLQWYKCSSWAGSCFGRGAFGTER